MENRTLLWSLDQANVDWWLYNPWHATPDLSRYDGAIVSVYRSYNHNFTFHCKEFEQRARDAGMPVVNTAENALGLHSFYLSEWQRAGVPCARFQRFRVFADLTLDTYPLILRRDGVHRGGEMFFAQNATDAREIIEEQHAESIAKYPDVRGPLPVDLAIEFIKTQRIDGYYCKWRSYVVGNEVIPAHFMRSRSPFVNYKDAALWAGTCSADGAFRYEGERYPERVLAAARATGFDIIALDYSVLEDGSYVFWEGNRIRATAGDTHVRWLEMREVDMEYGAAVVRLLERRVAEASRPRPAVAAPPRSSQPGRVGAADSREFVRAAR
jgi:hypothetical protein